MEHIMTLHNVSASYDGREVLSDLSLDIPARRITAVIGPSGCGKTTLLNALCGFIPVQSGEVAIASRTITHLAPEQRNITMVFQSYALWPHLTVARNISYGLKLRKWRGADIARRVAELLRIVNLEGLGEVKVTELSGGQRQRVAIARALTMEPALLIADEPTSMLDPSGKANLLRMLKGLQNNRGFSMLFITHDLDSALKISDRLFRLEKGALTRLNPNDYIQVRFDGLFDAG